MISNKINLPIGQKKCVTCFLMCQSHRCKVNDNMRSSPLRWKVGFPSPNVRGSLSTIKSLNWLEIIMYFFWEIKGFLLVFLCQIQVDVSYIGVDQPLIST